MNAIMSDKDNHLAWVRWAAIKSELPGGLGVSKEEGGRKEEKKSLEYCSVCVWHYIVCMFSVALACPAQSSVPGAGQAVTEHPHFLFEKWFCIKIGGSQGVMGGNF